MVYIQTLHDLKLFEAKSIESNRRNSNVILLYGYLDLYLSYYILNIVNCSKTV